MAKKTVKKVAKKTKAKAETEDVFEDPKGPKDRAQGDDGGLQAGFNDLKLKAHVLDEIIAMSANVTKLRNDYEISRDDCLQKKKAYDSAEKKMRERIDRIRQEESDPNLFNSGESGEIEPDGDDDFGSSPDEIPV